MGFAQFLPAATESAQHPVKRVITAQETVLPNRSVIIMDSVKILLVNKLAHVMIATPQILFVMEMVYVNQRWEKMQHIVLVIVIVEMGCAMQVPTEKPARHVLEIVEHV